MRLERERDRAVFSAEKLFVFSCVCVHVCVTFHERIMMMVVVVDLCDVMRKNRQTHRRELNHQHHHQHTKRQNKLLQF